MFTNQMDFPNFKDFVTLNESSDNGLIDLTMFKGDENVKDDNLIDWKIVSTSQKLIEIDLYFERPL